MLSTFPFKNYHAAKDGVVDLLTTVVHKCAGWPSWKETCQAVTRQAVLDLLHVQHGTSLSTAVSVLLRLVPTLAGAGLSATASTVPSAVSRSHNEAKLIVVSIIARIKELQPVRTDTTGEEEEKETDTATTATTAMTATTTDASLSLAKALIKRMCEHAPDRALPRTLALDAVLHIAVSF